MEKNDLLKEKESKENEVKELQKNAGELQKQMNVITIKQQRLLGVIEYLKSKLEADKKSKGK